jgi:hypothetical protein
MVKHHISQARLTDKHLKNYAEGKSITIKPSEYDNEDNHLAELHFTAKKHMNKFHRNLEHGKGTRISPSELHDIKLHDGKGFFDSIKRGFQSAGNAIKNTAQDVGHKIVDTVNDDRTKKFVKTVAPTLTKTTGALVGLGTGTAVTALSGNPALGAIAGNAVGGLTTVGLQAGADKYTGSGIKMVKGKRSVHIGGSFAPLGGCISSNVRLGGAIKALDKVQQFQGLGGSVGLDAMNPNQERMARIRGFIGKR